MSQLSESVFSTSMTLMPGVEMNVFAVRGRDYSLLIDTGIAGMREAVLDLCRAVGRVRYVLLTHIHADHIGCNRAVQELTGAPFFAGGAAAWAEDLETHYREFCLTDVLGDPPGQREEILGLMDGPVKIEALIGEGTRFRLGGVELETLALPGHKLEELGFYLPAEGTLILGDVLLAMAAPFFHGVQTFKGFFESLQRLERLLMGGQVRRVLSAHHPPLDAAGALEAVAQTRAHLEAIRAETLAAARDVSLTELWQTVSARLGKVAEFRGYATLQAQVVELTQEGLLRVSEGRVQRP